NTVIAALGLFLFRFVLLAILALIPGYLAAVQGYRPLETSRILDVSVVPVLVGGLLAAQLMRHVDARIVATLGLALVSGSALIDSRLTNVWIDHELVFAQTLLAAGLTTVLVAEIGMIALNLQATGAILPSGVV